MTERRAVAALGLLALLAWALVPQYPNYDAEYHLVWGRELRGGALPSFEAYAAPTPHPLFLLVTTLVPSERGLVLVTVAAWVLTMWAAYRLGRATLGRWPGLAGAALVASSFALLLYAARAYVDVPFLALVLWAAALEAERPRRGLLPAVLLLLAGLLRPEAWLLAGLYALWWRRPAGLALAAAAPLLWALTDLVVTGNPVHSLTATSELAGELGRERGLRNVPRVFAREVVDVARPPVALAGLVGAALLWRLRRGRSLHVLAALALAGTAAFAGAGVAGLSLIPRYLTVPVIVLMLLAGFALAGFAELPPGPARRRWARASAAAVVAGVALVAVLRGDVVDRLVTELRFTAAVHDDLHAILDHPRVRAALRCGPVTLPNYRLVPDTRWHLGEDVLVGARSARRRSEGVALFVLGQKMLQRYGFADGASPSTNAPDPGFVPIARTDRFAAYAACAGSR